MLFRPSAKVPAANPEVEIANKIRKAKNMQAFCSIFGYSHEEHQVTTEDGYILTLHRLLPKGASGPESLKGRPVVYLQHGLLTNSELFMSVTAPEKCLPLVLLESGYDIWLGNNRGNKYSRGHTSKSCEASDFWDYCIDDFVQYDIPNSISFIIKQTGSSKISYIGFSQGSAQGFGALSVNSTLSQSLNMFIALAPIMRPAGYPSPRLDSIVKKNPNIVYQIFGRKAMCTWIAFLQANLPTFLVTEIVDRALKPLLGYDNHNFSPLQKIASYSHIYCSCSVKTIVHWGQIMGNTVFSKFQDDPSAPVIRYPTEKITIPITLIHGDRDCLFEKSVVLEHLPADVTCHVLENYEHLDVLWGANVHVDVIPRVLDILNSRRTE
ncbi:Alpha/Beta hydrolase protein [Panaeolus papilionaceus]|nr:Alpha/Beta hydrolase protein [Panaeolus papilionaceus]